MKSNSTALKQMIQAIEVKDQFAVSWKKSHT